MNQSGHFQNQDTELHGEGEPEPFNAGPPYLESMDNYQPQAALGDDGGTFVAPLDRIVDIASEEHRNVSQPNGVPSLVQEYGAMSYYNDPTVNINSNDAYYMHGGSYPNLISENFTAPPLQNVKEMRTSPI